MVDAPNKRLDRARAELDTYGRVGKQTASDLILALFEAERQIAELRAELATVKLAQEANHNLAVANGERAREEHYRAEAAEAENARLRALPFKDERHLTTDEQKTFNDALRKSGTIRQALPLKDEVEKVLEPFATAEDGTTIRPAKLTLRTREGEEKEYVRAEALGELEEEVRVLRVRLKTLLGEEECHEEELARWEEAFEEERRARTRAEAEAQKKDDLKTANTRLRAIVAETERLMQKHWRGSYFGLIDSSGVEEINRLLAQLKEKTWERELE